MNPPVFGLLKASAAVRALVGADKLRIYAGGIAPQEAKTPYIVWQIIAGQPENYLADDPDMDYCRVQIDCWATARDQAVALYQAAVAALQRDAHQVSFNDDSQDFETKLWRQSFDVAFWLPR